MKFSVQRDAFRKALLAVNKAISGKSTLPILSNIHVRTLNHHTIEVSATNLELGIVCFVPATVTEEGSITFPGKISVDLVNNLPSDLITVSVSGTSILWQCQSFKNELMGLPSDDFPPLPVAENKPIALKKSFIYAIEHVVKAAALDDSRPVLTALRLTIKDGQAEMVCADGFRLARTSLNVTNENEDEDAPPLEVEVLIPAKTMQEVFNIMQNLETDYLLLYIDNAAVHFVGDNVKIVSRLIEGKYPDVQRVIPTEFQSEFVFNIDEMRKAAKIASLVTTNSGVKLTITETHIALTSQGASVGTTQAMISGVHKGTGHTINLNIKYFQDALEAVQSAGVKFAILKTISDQSPAIFKAVDNEQYLHVVMPLMVR